MPSTPIEIYKDIVTEKNAHLTAKQADILKNKSSN